MTDTQNTEVKVEAKAEMDMAAYSKLMEDLAKNPAVSEIKVTEGKDEVQPQ